MSKRPTIFLNLTSIEASNSLSMEHFGEALVFVGGPSRLFSSIIVVSPDASSFLGTTQTGVLYGDLDCLTTPLRRVGYGQDF